MKKDREVLIPDAKFLSDVKVILNSFSNIVT